MPTLKSANPDDNSTLADARLFKAGLLKVGFPAGEIFANESASGATPANYLTEAEAAQNGVADTDPANWVIQLSDNKHNIGKLIKYIQVGVLGRKGVVVMLEHLAAEMGIKSPTYVQDTLTNALDVKALLKSRVDDAFSELLVKPVPPVKSTDPNADHATKGVRLDGV